MILVTGGAGFIGGNFVLDWLKEPKAEGIVNLDKLTYAGNLATLDSLKNDYRHIFIHGDIGDHVLVTQLLKEHQPRAIVNFAAMLLAYHGTLPRSSKEATLSNKTRKRLSANNTIMFPCRFSL